MVPTHRNFVSALSLGKPVAVFPASVATDADLIVAVDRQQTRLALPLNASDTSMTVVDPTVIGANNLLSIDSEIVRTTGAATGNVVPIARAFDGTTAAVHLAGSAVTGFVDAYHHNRLAAEVQAIENALGANLSHIPTAIYPSSGAFIFGAQAPAGNLSVGANVITIAPVPLGVNGTDTHHYLLISGGAGAAEAVLIVGGTAVEGAASGTLIVNCANTHSGAWTIQTATAGIQEAVQHVRTVSGTGRVLIPAGAFQVFAPVYVAGNGGVFIEGAGMQSTALFSMVTDSSDVFRFDNPTLASGGGLSDLSILGNSARPNGWAIYLNNQSSFAVQNVHITGTPNGIRVINSGHFFENVNIMDLLNSNGAGFGTGVQIDSTGVPINYLRNVFYGGAATFAGIVIGSGGYLVMSDCTWTGANYGMLVNPIGVAVLSMEVLNSQFDNNLLAGMLIQPGAGGTVARSRFTQCWTTSCHGGPGIALSGGPGTLIAGLSFVHHQSSDNQQDGINMLASAAGVIKGITFDRLIASGNNKAAGAFCGVNIGPWANGVAITSSVIGPFADFTADGQASAIKIDATVDNVVITGNSFTGAGSKISDASGNLNKVIANNLGLDNATPPTVASGASISLGATDAPVFFISGTTPITTITGGWNGRAVTLIFTNAAPGGVATGGNIARTQAAAQNQALRLTFNGATWY